MNGWTRRSTPATPSCCATTGELAADHLEVIAGDKGEADLGLDPQTWQRLADTVDLIVDPAALVNHVLPYSQLFGPNALGTAELIRIALTSKQKPFVYVSTIGVGAGIEPGQFTEDADIRVISTTRKVDDSYANGYSNSKWAGEVLLREAHDLCGLPVSVFRCDMILADTTYAGQLNLPDMFTRLMLSLVATGIAPGSFYELDADGNRQRAHYDGLPVEFIAEAISTLGERAVDGFETYHVMNPYDDGIGLDEYVDWLIEAGYPVERVGDYASWLQRFDTAVRALPERQRQASLLPLLHNYQRPETPIRGSIAPTDRFRSAVQDAKIGPDKDIPHVTPEIIVKYITDLQLLGLLLTRLPHLVDDLNNVVGHELRLIQHHIVAAAIGDDVHGAELGRQHVVRLVDLGQRVVVRRDSLRGRVLVGAEHNGGDIRQRRRGPDAGKRVLGQHAFSPGFGRHHEVAFECGVLRGIAESRQELRGGIDHHEPADQLRMSPRQKIEHQAAIGMGDEDERSRQLGRPEQRDEVVDILLHAMRLRHRGGQVGAVGPRVRPVVRAHQRGLRHGWLHRIGAGYQLGLRDDVVRRRPNRVVRRDDVVPRLGVAALAGDDEHRRRTATLAVQEQLSAVADVEQTGGPAGLSCAPATPTRCHGEDREQHAEPSPHMATIHRQPHARSTMAIRGKVPCMTAALTITRPSPSRTGPAAPGR